MKFHPSAVLAAGLLLAAAAGRAVAADGLKHRETYAQAYGATKGAVAVDPAKDLPRYAPVAPADAVATWRVKPGFRLELAAHEPQVRDPIALSFDENGRLFVCEMIDYSEDRDVQPHLGRISLLEDRDGDGVYETSRVFADGLAWPTALIWANGGLFVAATPDILRLEDRDGDGRAEVREQVFTGFGTGLARLNVQALPNNFQWGQDNRIHLQTSLGNRGLIRSPRRPDLPAVELGGRDFWFDPRTYDFGFAAGGAQYGMSFDDFGRKFACSNSDHLQFYVYDERYAARNPFFTPPPARQSIAADGGAAEVFRISPDEPWRIIRTRWRIGGVIKGPIEGGGRVSGYFTGATGTTVYRGDAYGPEFANNTFTGDAGGQLIHRKQLHPDGVSLVGRRPADEQGVEFAASTDTWVRIVNFANAPDGTLHVCDMYREVIEHPWSIPTEIKQHLDLTHGRDRGRLYRLAPADPAWRRRSSVALGRATTAELVATLSHPNGWHRDTATRLLYERQDRAAVPALAALLRTAPSPVAQLHALAALDGLGALDAAAVGLALGAADPVVRERGILLAEKLAALPPALAEKLAALADDPAPRVRFQLAFTVPTLLAAAAGENPALARAAVRLAARDHGEPWIAAALLSSPPQIVARVLLPAFQRDRALAKAAAGFVAKLLETAVAAAPAADRAALIAWVAQPEPSALWLRALGDGLRRAGVSFAEADPAQTLKTVFAAAARTAPDASAAIAARREAIDLLGVAPWTQAREPLVACLAPAQPEAIQVAAATTLGAFAEPAVATELLRHWRYAPAAKQAVLAALLRRDERALALLDAIAAGKLAATELSAAQVQTLAGHTVSAVATRARTVLAGVIPPSRAEVAATFQAATTTAGDAGRGQAHYAARCQICHRAGDAGLALGPDLVTVKNRGRDALLAAILDPHREVAPQYIAYDVATKDGQAYTGLIVRDDATGLGLRVMGGAEIALARAAIKGSTSSGRSLMPEGLEAGMSVQDMADLLTFIEELR